MSRILSSKDWNPLQFQLGQKFFLLPTLGKSWFWLILIELGVLVKVEILLGEVCQQFKYNTFKSCGKMLFNYPWNFPACCSPPSWSRVCSQVMQSQSFWWFSRQILIKSLRCRGNRIGCNRGSSNCNTAGLRRFWPNIQPSFCHQLNIQPIIVILMGVSIILNITTIFTIIPIILLPLVSSGSLCSFGLLCLAAIASTFERFRRLLPWNKR